MYFYANVFIGKSDANESVKDRVFFVLRKIIYGDWYILKVWHYSMEAKCEIDESLDDAKTVRKWKWNFLQKMLGNEIVSVARFWKFHRSLHLSFIVTFQCGWKTRTHRKKKIGSYDLGCWNNESFEVDVPRDGWWGEETRDERGRDEKYGFGMLDRWL